jgi:ADP-ribose pyrophosphatase YjhB (NUDIX family)
MEPTNTNNTTLGVLIGRFQADALHTGHLGLLDHALDNCDELLVLVGRLPAPLNATNPLPFEAIEQMIGSEVRGHMIKPVTDNASNQLWSESVDALIDEAKAEKGCENVRIFCGRDGFIPYYHGKYSVNEVDLGCPQINASKIREEIGEEVENDAAWRRGVIWAMQNLQHRTYHTVDMACLHAVGDGTINILLAQKPDSDKWRFPGGFVEKGEKFVVAAGREFREETGLYTVDGFRIVDDFIIDDWRVRRQKGVDQKTVLCVGWHSHGQPKASDDISNVAWHNFIDVYKNAESMMVSEHKAEMIYAIANYLKNSRFSTIFEGL